MKIFLDTEILVQLRKVYGSGAGDVLMQALERADVTPLEMPLIHGALTVTPEFVAAAMNTAAPSASAAHVLKLFNEITGKKFRPIDSTMKMIRALLKDYRMDEIEFVIRNKSAQWKGDYQMDKYLRPPTLFTRRNFENYLNEKPAFKLQEKNLALELDALLEQNP